MPHTCHPVTSRKTILSVTSCLLAVSMSWGQAYASNTQAKEMNQVVKSYTNPSKASAAKFVYEPELAPGVYTYIVELSEQSVAQAPLSAQALINARKQKYTGAKMRESFQRDTRITRQLGSIERQQAYFMQEANLLLQGVKSVAKYKYAVNGVAMRLTQQQAQKLASLSSVIKITREQSRQLDTDRGPTFIGANKIWNGEASEDISPLQGEGIVVGIIDSGINTDHPSFAAQSADGYVHVNPLGDNVYLGDCAGSFSQLCNSKLIGVYSYSVITSKYSDTDVFPPNLPANGEDYDGHGSHVASTAAGNVLLDLVEITPELNKSESDGVEGDFTFDRISGVAPRANIISYQVCFGGSRDTGDTYGGCLSSAILSAIDDAIEDGVDVLNMSISGGGDPWDDATEKAFLRAQSVGIFVATSAGNSGPNKSTSEKLAPWYTSVAASEHGRENVYLKSLGSMTSSSGALAQISGQSKSGSVTAPIVYAGDFPNPNDPNGDPAQCLQPYPANTFSGQIVLCDRGSIARVQKAQNVASGGAGGYVLANVDDGTTFLANDEYVVPGIHINAEDGNALRNWLDQGSNHTATISDNTPTSIINQERIDVMADFSSRGPNTQFSTLVPTVAAPGVSIYAAYADQQFGRDGNDSVTATGDFSYLGGTSMASPHVAGAAALVKNAHPDWTPDQIRSALSFTTTIDMKKEDAEESADFFDMGAGRIRVDLAVATGLVMNETKANYEAADPDLGGDPRTLNIPSITDNECLVTCKWSRTFTATKDATWTFAQKELNDSLLITASPSTFSLTKGQTQEVEFTIQVKKLDARDYIFGRASLQSPGLPDVDIPVSVLLSIGDIPSLISFTGQRSKDSTIVSDITAVNIDDFVLTGYKPVKAKFVNSTVSQDSNRPDYLDDINDGTAITLVTAEEDAQRLIAKIVSTSASDLDLYVLRDDDGDGRVSSSEEVARSQRADSNDEIEILLPEAGDYYIVVHNFSGGTDDTYRLKYALVTSEVADDELSALAPNTLHADEPFSMEVIYDLPFNGSNTEFYGALAMGDSTTFDSLGMIPVNIIQGKKDVRAVSSAQRLVPSDSASFEIVVNENETSLQRDYEITAIIPSNVSITNFSNEFGATQNGNKISWNVSKNAGNNEQTRLSVDIEALDGIDAGPIPIVVESRLLNRGFDNTESIDIKNIQVEGPPEIGFGNSDSIELNVVETKRVDIPIDINDPNDDAVTLTWVQTEGPQAAVQGDGPYFVIAPNVSEQTTLTYEVTGNDGTSDSSKATVSIVVSNNTPPVIDSISFPSSANGGQQITITINASDADGDPLTYSINGNNLASNSGTQAVPRTGSQVTFNIGVSDGIDQVTQSVTVNLTQSAASSGGGGGGSLSWYTLLLLPLVLLRRKHRLS